MLIEGRSSFWTLFFKIIYAYQNCDRFELYWFENAKGASDSRSILDSTSLHTLFSVSINDDFGLCFTSNTDLCRNQRWFWTLLLYKLPSVSKSTLRVIEINGSIPKNKEEVSLP